MAQLKNEDCGRTARMASNLGGWNRGNRREMLIVENHIKEGAVYVHLLVVLDEAQLAKFI